MALQIADRIRESSTTTGTGTLTLAGAQNGFQAFSVIGNGNTTYYCIVNQNVPSEWEVGIGTYTLSGTTLSRTQIIASSNSNNAVSFSAGTKDVFCTYPAAAVPSPHTCEGRLTLTSGTPATSADVTGASNLYFTPYKGNKITLYNGNFWQEYTFSEMTQAITVGIGGSSFSGSGTTTSGSPTVTGISSTSLIYIGQPVGGTGIAAGTTVKSVDSSTQVTLSQNATVSATNTLTYYTANIDVFIAYSAGSLIFVVQGWTNNTTRLTALALQDGVWVQSTQPGYRYVGTFRLTGTTTSEDSVLKRFVWNNYNRVRKHLLRSDGSSYVYTTAALRQTNANTANQVNVVVGLAESLLDLLQISEYGVTAGNVAAAFIGSGEDSTTAVSSMGGSSVGCPYASPSAKLVKMPSIGYHFYAMLEQGAGTVTTTWYNHAIAGSIDC